jgi:hypothetical protein
MNGACEQRTPDFFIVGHPKCGTTALYRMLRSHPEIFMPELKETRFFAPELHPNAQAHATHPRTLERYLALFAPATASQRAGEASPSYLRSHTAAARIAEVQPDARIVAILREPAGFLHSLHMELVRDHVESESDLRRALALEHVRARERDTRPGLVYADYVCYAEQLRRYHDVFGRERVLVLIYDDFRADNAATVRRVLRFLGVDESLPVSVQDANPTVRVRSVGAYERVRSLYLGEGRAARLLGPALKTISTQRMRRGALDVLRRRVLYAQPRPPDERLTIELRRRFRDEVVALGNYLNRDLIGLWGYDGL